LIKRDVLFLLKIGYHSADQGLDERRVEDDGGSLNLAIDTWSALSEIAKVRVTHPLARQKASYVGSKCAHQDSAAMFVEGNLVPHREDCARLSSELDQAKEPHSSDECTRDEADGRTSEGGISV
jgi:hypothetical protein